MESTLLASSATQEGILKMIANYYYSDPAKFRIEPVDDKAKDFDILKNGVKLGCVRVEKRRNRYRFILLH